MFEGKPPRPEVSATPGTARDGDVLRPIEWSELAARLAAARDLRASLRLGEGDGEASFDALSARWIAAHREGKDLVNHEASANGKGAGRRGDAASPGNPDGAARD